MERGVEVDIHLTPGIPNENFIGELLGNLAAFRLGRQRGETLRWQVIRVEEGHSHHFRLLVHHPERRLDWGFQHDLKRQLDELSRHSVDELRALAKSAEGEGLRLVPLRHLTESPDYWQDDFWNWIG